MLVITNCSAYSSGVATLRCKGTMNCCRKHICIAKASTNDRCERGDEDAQIPCKSDEIVSALVTYTDLTIFMKILGHNLPKSIFFIRFGLMIF